MLTVKIKANKVQRGDVLWEPPDLQKVTFVLELKKRKRIKLFFRGGEATQSVKDYEYTKVLLLDDTPY